jgi:hypothetical protein
LIGTLESQVTRIAQTNDAGASAVVVGISWDRAEPQEQEFDASYFRSVQDKITAFRAGGKSIVLDSGVQYPPDWIFRRASSHFVNQYGDSFTAAPGSGNCGVNLVFSEDMREQYGVYLDHLFHELGTDFAAIRLGGGRYGELGYPAPVFNGRDNCYWAFDPLAQGKQPGGLPPGVLPCPVPSWLPGQPSPTHDSARQFLNWYMESMRNFHDWQIATVRKNYAGPLFMLYPSIGGLRPGQLEAAVQDDANGATGAEKTGEVGRGYDTSRFVAGISDPNVIVYSTWIDGFSGSDDASVDPRHWSPGHFLASLASAHQPPLLVGGENTGSPDDVANMELVFRRLHEEHLCALFWAFEGTLFDVKDHHATIQDFKRINSAAIQPAGP